MAYEARRRPPASVEPGKKYRLGGMQRIRFMKHGDDITILRGNVMASKQEVLDLFRLYA